MPAHQGPGPDDARWPYDPAGGIADADYDLEDYPEDDLDDFPWPDEGYDDPERY